MPTSHFKLQSKKALLHNAGKGYRYVGVHLQGLRVEPQTLLDVSGAVPESVTDGLLAACHSATFGAVQAAITNAIADGWGVRHGP
jgi:hypothetical protein